MRDLSIGLRQRQAEHRYRSRRTLSRSGVYCQQGDQRLLAFCSNDYLGLSQHPAVIAAFQQAANEYGIGSGAAHLINGHSPAHHAFENELAAFLGQPRALLFSTGYMANLALLSAICQKGDLILEDRLNHASLIDGGLLSPARLKRYRHADMNGLKEMLTAAGNVEKLVVSDGVFSMDGDIAPLPKLAEQCKAHAAWLMIDDAHGFGVLGPRGRGSPALFGLDAADLPIHMVTLGKALGTFGAAVAGSEELIETLIQQARPYIYTTAPPPALAEASRSALRILAEEEWRREHLAQRIQQFSAGAERLGLPLMPSRTPIQPLLLGGEERALAWSAALEKQGILVTAIRPPTVPVGGSRLRITLSAAHSPEHVTRLLDALETISAKEPVY